MDENALLEWMKNLRGKLSLTHRAMGTAVTLKHKSGYEVATVMRQKDRTESMEADGDLMKRMKVD